MKGTSALVEAPAKPTASLKIAAPRREVQIAIDDGVLDASGSRRGSLTKSLSFSTRPLIEGVVSLKPAFSFDYCKGSHKSFMGEARYATLSPTRLALFHSFQESKTGSCPAEVISPAQCKTFKIMKDLMACDDPVCSINICFTPAQPSRFDAWLDAMVKAGFGKPEYIPLPGMSCWKGDEEEPIIHKGWLDFEVKGSRVSGYTLLLPDRLASWSSQQQATSGEIPEGVVNLKDIVGVETISNGFVLNKGVQKVTALVDDPAELRSWAAAIFLAIASPQGQAGMSWKPTSDQPWRDAALRPRLGKGLASGRGRQARKPNGGKEEGRAPGSPALDTESNLALRPQRFRDELRATAVIMCQRLKAAAFTCTGMDWKGLLRDLSKESSGLLTWEDFLNMCRKTLKLLDDEEHLQACFRILDADDSGVIDVEELIVFIADPLKNLQKREQLDALEAEAGLAARSPKLRGLLLDMLLKIASRMKAKAGSRNVKQLVAQRSGNDKTLRWDEFLLLCREDLGMEDQEALLRCAFRSLDGALLGEIRVEDVAAFVSDPVARIHSNLKKAVAATGFVGCDGKGWQELIKAQARGKARLDWADFRVMCRKRLRMMDDDAHLWLVYRTLNAEEQGCASVADLGAFMATGKAPVTEIEKVKATPVAAAPRRSKVGDRVSVSGRLGTIRFIGGTHFAKGDWLGIELDNADGKNNGTLASRRYFRCEENHGIFVRPSLVSFVTPEDLKSHSEAKKKEAHAEPPAAPASLEPPSLESVSKDFESLTGAGGFAQEQLVASLKLGEQTRRMPVARSCTSKETLQWQSRGDALNETRSPITLAVESERDGPEFELFLRSSDSDNVVSQGSYKVNLEKLTPARWQTLRKPLCQDGVDSQVELECTVFYEPARARRAGQMPISFTVLGSKGLDPSIEHYCVVTVQGSKTSFRQQIDLIPGAEPVWDHKAAVEDFTQDDHLAFAVWRRTAGSWDKLIGKAVLTPDKLKEGFDGDLGLSSSPSGAGITRLRVIAKPIVLPGESVQKGLLHVHIGDVFLNSHSKQTACAARSPSPCAGTAATDAELRSSSSKRSGTRSMPSMRINTGRQEAAVLMQGPHAAFMLPPGERTTRGGYHVRDFPISEKVMESQEAGSGKAVGRPGDSTEGVAGKVNVGESGRVITSPERGREAAAVSWGKPNHNPTDGSGGFYSARGCSEPPASKKGTRAGGTGAASPRGVLDITSKIQDPGPTLYRRAACAR